jgi:hypothetical protein
MSLESPAIQTVSKKKYASSIKAIMYARHANTRRKINQSSLTPWIGEMIVVKEYDQMDSLREILVQHPRKDGPRIQTKTEDCVDFAEYGESLGACENGVEESDLKRKREDSDSEALDSPLKQVSKRRRVMSDAGNQGPLPMEDIEFEKLDASQADVKGKENIPPTDVCPLWHD